MNTIGGGHAESWQWYEKKLKKKKKKIWEYVFGLVRIFSGKVVLLDGTEHWTLTVLFCVLYSRSSTKWCLRLC